MFKQIKLKQLSGKALLPIIIYVVAKWTIIILFGSYLYRNNLWHPAYFLAFPVLALMVLYIRKRKKRRAAEAAEQVQ